MDMLNPLEIIKNDHEKVKMLLDEYETLDHEDKHKQLDKISDELLIHTEMEEEYFYPRIKVISDDAEELIDDSIDEHDEIKAHLTQAYSMEDEADMDTHVQEMKDAIMHHIEEEESEMFRLAESNLKDDFTGMATEMEAFKLKEKGGNLLRTFKEKLNLG